MSKLMRSEKKIEETVVDGYKKIENGVVSGYKKIEDGAVSGYKKVEDKFVKALFTKENESVEDAKKRMAANEAKSIKEQEKYTIQSKEKTQRAIEAAREKAGINSNNTK